MSSRLQNMEVNRVQIIKDPVLGNALAASENFEPGDVAISIPEPFLIVVEQGALDRVCSYCLIEKDLSTLKKCTGCKIVRYCSTTCQKADWKLIHQKECAILKRLPGVPPTPVRALIQLLLRHQYGQGLDPQWAGLESHTDGFMKGKRFDGLLLQAKGAVEFSGSPQDRMEIAINLLCRVSPFPFHASAIYINQQVSDGNQRLPCHSRRRYPRRALLRAHTRTSKSLLQPQCSDHVRWSTVVTPGFE